MTNPEHVALACQVIGVLGMLLAFAIMLCLRAKEQREQTKRELKTPLLNPPATPETDQHDWHGAPVSKPR